MVGSVPSARPKGHDLLEYKTSDTIEDLLMVSELSLQPLLAAIDADDDERAEAAVIELASTNGAALPLLLELSHSQDQDRRWWAVRGLAAMAEQDGNQRAASMPVLMDALNDPDDAVRCVACIALGQLEATSAIPALVLMLADSSGWVRSAAADALTMIGEPSVPALGEALQDERDGVRVRAAYALRKIQSPKSARWLFPALGDSNHLVHTYAYDALNEMGLLETLLIS